MTDTIAITAELLLQHLQNLNRDLCCIIAQYYVQDDYKLKFIRLRENAFNMPNCSICIRDESNCDLHRCEKCCSFVCGDNSDYCSKQCSECGSFKCLMCAFDDVVGVTGETESCSFCNMVYSKLLHEITREESYNFVRKYISEFGEIIRGEEFDISLDLDNKNFKQFVNNYDPLKEYRKYVAAANQKNF